MHLFKGVLARIRAIVHGTRADRELDEEICFHLEQEAAKHERSGIPPGEARRRAMVAFGGVTRTREAHRDVRVVRWLADLVADARFALRSIRRTPMIASAAVITLALGIGAATAIYTVVDAVLLKPLPFPHPEQLFVIGEDNTEREWHLQVAAPANYLDWKERLPAVASIGGYADGHASTTFTGDGEPRMVTTVQVTGTFFSVLGAQPALGRTFRDEETWEGATPTAVVSSRFWRSALGGDSAAIGKSIRLNSKQFVVVGVMPSTFAYPYRDADVWLTMQWSSSAREQQSFRRAHYLRVITRLRPSVTAASADVQLQSLVRRLQQEYPETNEKMSASMVPLRAFLNGDERRPLLLLFGAVGLLLLIACANVGNLLLVRSIGKQRELSLRLALGAGHPRLVRQALTESFLLSLLGGIAGLAVGWMGVRALASTQSAELLPVQEFGIDWRVLVFLLLVTTVSALLFGIAPSLWGQRQHPANALREGSRSSSDGRRMRRWANTLAVGEVALALLLTVGAGLLVRSYAALRRVDPGFQPSGVLTVSIEMPGGRYDSTAVLTQFDRALLDRVRATPGVLNASIVSSLPLTGSGWTSDFAVRGRARDDFATEVRHREVSGDYFGTMRVPLLRGRTFTEADATSGDHVIVVNDVLARKYFHDTDPVGQQIVFDRAPDSTSKWRTIVGVVASERQLGMQIEAHDEIFAPLAQEQQGSMVLVVRTAGEPLAFVPATRRALREIDPNLAIESVQTMDDVLDTSLGRDRFLMTMLLMFASVGIVLAIVGVYGVLAQTARRRTREMGVRIALGARAAQLRWLVLAHGLKLVTAGLLIGAMLALVLTRAMQRVLFDVQANDPLTYLAVALLLAATGAAASWLPAYRASITDPAVVLRVE
ncbi:MAG: ABC transporter permease [Gemmatimonadota bacterium]